MKREYLFLIVVGMVFGALTLLFVTFPRSTYSELERRELTSFPEFSFGELTSGRWTRAVSSWFSDTEPARDRFMTASMDFKSRIGLNRGEDNLAFHAADGAVDMGMIEEEIDPEIARRDSALAAEMSEREISEFNNLILDENAKVANAGIIIAGTGENVRALMAYGGTGKGGGGYARTANLYRETFGPEVNIYVMVIPTAAEFYTPEKARKYTHPQLPTIRNIYSQLAPDVHAVDVYTPLGEHADEPIYLRTDHHWSPLGAYYAARKLAQVAGVPFADLSEYTPHTIRNFVGSMYGYSKDASIKNAPEDFVYYTPDHLSYTTTFINYTVDKGTKAVRESAPVSGRFFQPFKDGSSSAYCTFMGGDMKLTKVETGIRNGRRLVIIKDSFGNAIPGYLFGSFEEIHVLDHRYFRHNLQDYVHDNAITDLVMANNIFNAYSDGVCSQYRRMLKGSAPAPAPKVEPQPESIPESAPEVVPETITAPEQAPEPTVVPEDPPEPEIEVRG